MLYTWQFILFSCYSIILTLLYIFVIIILVTSKDFKAPFFRLASVLGVVVSDLSRLSFMLIPLTKNLSIDYNTKTIGSFFTYIFTLGYMLS